MEVRKIEAGMVVEPLRNNFKVGRKLHLVHLFARRLRNDLKVRRKLYLVYVARLIKLGEVEADMAV